MKPIIKFKSRFYKILSSRKNNKDAKRKINVGKLHLIYRTSDAGYPKTKPEYINNRNCLNNALSKFNPKVVDWHIICDNCSEATMEEIYSLCDKYGVDKEHVYKKSVGHGAGTFRIAYEMALTFPENDLVYFLENDYLHVDKAYEALMNIFTLKKKVDYATLYDHPDKYESNYPYSSLYSKTTVYFDGLHHWQRIPSTTMTFAAKVSTLKKDKKVFWAWTKTKHPYDLYIFLQLKRRVLVSPIVSLSTHGETAFLSPCVDWEKISRE